jgi:DNA invertase Pin-like site-specific DNA recombinase
LHVTTIGYARVSTFEQILDLQRDALTAAKCDRIVTDTMSGSRSDQPRLEQALDYLREGDVLIVWRLDRLGRSLKYLIELITQLNERGVGFKSLTEQIDTTTSADKLIFHVFGALAEFERDIIRGREWRRHGHGGGRGAGRRSWTPRPRWQWRRPSMRTTATRSRTSARAWASRATLYRYLDSPETKQPATPTRPTASDGR